MNYQDLGSHICTSTLLFALMQKPPIQTTVPSRQPSMHIPVRDLIKEIDKINISGSEEAAAAKQTHACHHALATGQYIVCVPQPSQ